MESLEALESRIRKAVELVGQLRTENEGLRQQVASGGAAQKRVEELTDECQALRNEREIVRKRLEKLLDAIDQVNAG